MVEHSVGYSIFDVDRFKFLLLATLNLVIANFLLVTFNFYADIV